MGHGVHNSIIGNVGVIWTLITKAQATGPDALGHQDFFRTVSALCLYCYESVNRMKIRDAGGLRHGLLYYWMGNINDFLFESGHTWT